MIGGLVTSEGIPRALESEKGTSRKQGLSTNPVPNSVRANSVFTASGKKVVHKPSFKLSSKSGWGKLSLNCKW